MLGIIVDVLSVAVGGALGTVAGKLMSKQFTTQLNLVFGVCSMGMGVGSIVSMENMPPVILALVLGTALGLIIKLGKRISKAGELLQKPVDKILGGTTSFDLPREEYLSLLVTTIVLFCSSATGIYGSMDAGMTGDSTVLISKAILDLFTAMVFACSLGAVVSVVALPQFVVFFTLFLAAKAILPLTTPAIIADFRACGGFMLLATGLRVTKVSELPIADMLPAMVLVMPLSGFWTSYIIPLL